MNASKTGLVHKYNVTKADGSPCDPGSYYFILRLDPGGEPNHVKACRIAWKAYAEAIRWQLPMLADDIVQQLKAIEVVEQNADQAEQDAMLNRLQEDLNILITPEEHKTGMPLSTLLQRLSASEKRLLEEVQKPLILE